MGIVTLEHFAHCVGEGFQIDMGTEVPALTLTEARPLPEQGFAGMTRAPFALLFRAALRAHIHDSACESPTPLKQGVILPFLVA